MLASSSPATARDCTAPPPLCEAFWSYGAVFDGTVVRIEAIQVERDVNELWTPGSTDPGGLSSTYRRVRRLVPRTRVTYRINRSWSGVTTTEIQTLEDPLDSVGQADAYQAPRVGARWLVLARRNVDGTLETNKGECAVTVPYEQAGQELAFLQSLSQPSDRGRIFGQVSPFHRLPDGLGPVGVTLTGAGVSRSISTRDEFTFDDLPLGAYAVQAVPPPGLKNRGPSTQTLRLDHPHECMEAFLDVEPAGTVEGLVLGSDGRPAASQSLSLMVQSEWLRDLGGLGGRTVSTDETGRFQFTGVPPGRYVLGTELPESPAGVVRSSAIAVLGSQPDQPDVIDVAASAVSVNPFRVPALPGQPVTIQVRWRDGSPVADLAVGLSDVTWQLPRAFQGKSGAATDLDGRATFRLERGHTFELAVWTFGTAPHPDRPNSYEAPRPISSTVSFTVPPDVSEFVVFVEPLSR